jgi:outer membrane protein assembly factor BamB
MPTSNSTGQVLTDVQGRGFASSPVLTTALLAGLFCLVICVTMLVRHVQARAEDPLKSPQLLALKEQLLAHPKDEVLKAKIRALDLQLRRRYFQQLSLNGFGAWLALGGLGAFLLAGKQVAASRQRLPMPQPNPHGPAQWARTVAWGRWSVAGAGCVIGLGLLLVALGSETPLPRDVAAVEKLLQSASGGAAIDFASVTELEENWPQFRGPGGNGSSKVTNLPQAWDIKTGSGVAWKAELKADGFNSPIVWAGRVFLSGGDASKRTVLCYGTERGDLLWERTVQGLQPPAGEAPEIPEQTGFAASTMATDGRRVYAIFATGELVAFTLEGKQVWVKSFGWPKNPHGHASSLTTWEGRLLVQLDQGEAEQNLSKLYCLEGATGRILWQRHRAVPSSWATPMVIQPSSGKAQIITLAVPWIIAYAAQDGAELWRAEGLNNEVTPSPIFAGGMVLAISPNEKLMALRPDGQGDVTKTHLVWSAEDNIPDISSPVSHGEWVFTLSTPGMLTCYALKDGKKHWEQDLAMECNASPTIVGNVLYLIGSKGLVLTVEPGPAFKELARSDLGEKVFASPAVVRGRIFLRGVKHLFCIAQEQRVAATH